MAYGDNEKKVMFRLPPDLFRAIKELAKMARPGKRRNISEYLRAVVQEHVERQQKENRHG